MVSINNNEVVLTGTDAWPVHQYDPKSESTTKIFENNGVSDFTTVHFIADDPGIPRKSARYNNKQKLISICENNNILYEVVPDE